MSNIGQVSSMVKFLKATHLSSQSLVQLPSRVKVKIVLGNQACDLDTAACTLAYAIFLQLLNENSSEIIVLPVFNIPRKDLVLRTEIIYLLEKYQMPTDQLIFREELDLNIKTSVLVKQRQLEVILVDHHFDPELNGYVVEIIDHRPKEYDYPKTAQVTNELVGSCSSLVMQKILKQQADKFINEYPEVVLFLYGAILLDTNNLSTLSKRWTPTDLDVLSAIEPKLIKDGKVQGRDICFKELMSARCNVDSLSPLDMLSKDSKKVSTLPVCALTMLVQKYSTLEGAEGALQSYCEANETNLIILVGIHVDVEDNKVHRDLGFYSNSAEGENIQMANYLKKSLDPNLQMEEVTNLDKAIQGLVIYQQNNLAMTRKHLLPLLKSAFSIYKSKP